MDVIYFLLGGAAFFGIWAWILEIRRGKPFEVDGDDHVPFSYKEQERARIEGEIITRTHGTHRTH